MILFSNQTLLFGISSEQVPFSSLLCRALAACLASRRELGGSGCSPLMRPVPPVRAARHMCAPVPAPSRHIRHSVRRGDRGASAANKCRTGGTLLVAARTNKHRATGQTLSTPGCRRRPDEPTATPTSTPTSTPKTTTPTTRTADTDSDTDTDTDFNTKNYDTNDTNRRPETDTDYVCVPRGLVLTLRWYCDH